MGQTARNDSQPVPVRSDRTVGESQLLRGEKRPPAEERETINASSTACDGECGGLTPPCPTPCTCTATKPNILLDRGRKSAPVGGEPIRAAARNILQPFPLVASPHTLHDDEAKLCSSKRRKKLRLRTYVRDSEWFLAAKEVFSGTFSRSALSVFAASFFVK